MFEKRYGTREEVFKEIAHQTTGGLTKNDLICKKKDNTVIYISKKLSNAMKETDNLKKYRRKKTISRNNFKNNSRVLTKKISFNSKPVVNEYYYPELEGENLKHIRDEYLEEELNDFGITNEVEVEVQDINNISDLDKSLEELFDAI